MSVVLVSAPKCWYLKLKKCNQIFSFLWCSKKRVFRDLSVSPTYVTSQSSQVMWYTEPTTFTLSTLSLGSTNSCWRVLVGLKYAGMSKDLKTTPQLFWDPLDIRQHYWIFLLGHWCTRAFKCLQVPWWWMALSAPLHPSQHLLFHPPPRSVQGPIGPTPGSDIWSSANIQSGRAVWVVNCHNMYMWIGRSME